MNSIEDTRLFLRSLNLPPGDLYDLPTSTKRFPDGAQYRIEIPSTEGRACLHAVIEEAERLGVTIHRVSQGSGVLMLTDDEIDEMSSLASAKDMEVSLFARPNASWDTSAMSLASAGGVVSPRARGQDQLIYCLEDIKRAADHGIRSVLLADEGVLWVAAKMRSGGELPADMQFKMSVMMASANPASIRLMQDLGADTYNIPTDLTLPQIASIRAAVDIPLDIYVEVPDDVGGFVRLYEIPELIRIASPVYIKLGLRNAPNIYPVGKHLESVAVLMSRERVRRAKIAVDIIQRYYPDAVQSAAGAKGLAVPVPRRKP